MVNCLKTIEKNQRAIITDLIQHFEAFQIAAFRNNPEKCSPMQL